MKHWWGASIAETIVSRLESLEDLHVLLGYVEDVRVWCTGSGVSVIHPFGNTGTVIAKSLMSSTALFFLLVRLSALNDKRLGYYLTSRARSRGKAKTVDKRQPARGARRSNSKTPAQMIDGSAGISGPRRAPPGRDSQQGRAQSREGDPIQRRSATT